MVFTVPPIRRYLGEEPIAKIPMTYPGMWTPEEEPTSFLRDEQERSGDAEEKKDPKDKR